jgi:error-prone DNA polymerase
LFFEIDTPGQVEVSVVAVKFSNVHSELEGSVVMSVSVATTPDGVPTRLEWDGRSFDVARKPLLWVDLSAWWSTAARAPRGAGGGLLEHLLYRLTVRDQAGHRNMCSWYSTTPKVSLGISLAEADELRHKMEKHADGIEENFRKKTSANLDEHGKRRFTDADVDRIWKVLAGFASYGFCKAHGAAFALPTYQSAWLKTHYPVEFLAGVFEHDPGMYERRLLMAEARRMGIHILLLDVNASTDEYMAERTDDGTKAIRYSLTDVHGITQPERDRILAGQPYESIMDFWMRATPSRRLLVDLATVGALDTLADSRSGRGDIIAYAQQLGSRRKPKTGKHKNQLELYATDDIPAGHREPSTEERIGAELNILSTEINQHLIESYRPLLDSLGVTPAADLVNLPSKTEVIVADVRVATQTPPMRSGKRVVFISLDDGTGCSDSTFFNEAQERSGPLLFGTKLMLIRGRTRRTGARGVSLQAEEAFDLRQAWATFDASRL